MKTFNTLKKKIKYAYADYNYSDGNVRYYADVTHEQLATGLFKCSSFKQIKLVNGQAHNWSKPCAITYGDTYEYALFNNFFSASDFKECKKELELLTRLKVGDKFKIYLPKYEVNNFEPSERIFSFSKKKGLELEVQVLAINNTKLQLMVPFGIIGGKFTKKDKLSQSQKLQFFKLDWQSEHGELLKTYKKSLKQKEEIEEIEEIEEEYDDAQ